MQTYRRLRLFGLIGFTLLAVFGCASQQPLSHYARSGDTVAVSLGGTDSNALASVLKKENITVTLTDAANSVHPLKVRNVFRVYSDRTSRYDYRSPTSNFSAGILSSFTD